MRVLIVVVLFFGALGYWVSTLETVCMEHKTVAEIGGCDRWDCGVRYTDGTFGEQHNAVVGKRVCSLWVTRSKE